MLTLTPKNRTVFCGFLCFFRLFFFGGKIKECLVFCFVVWLLNLGWRACFDGGAFGLDLLCNFILSY